MNPLNADLLQNSKKAHASRSKYQPSLWSNIPVSLLQCHFMSLVVNSPRDWKSSSYALLALQATSCSPHVGSAAAIISDDLALAAPILLLLVLRPLVLASVRRKTTSNRTEDDVTVLVLVAKLSSCQAANNGTSNTSADATGTSAERLFEFTSNTRSRTRT